MLVSFLDDFKKKLTKTQEKNYNLLSKLGKVVI